MNHENTNYLILLNKLKMEIIKLMSTLKRSEQGTLSGQEYYFPPFQGAINK